jgi:pimeloyl-ACP methyl ester carboxylesterase
MAFTHASGAAPVVHYQTASIEGVQVFYREAGPADAPAIVLLHGFPSSSNMFRNLIPALADRYRVIAPDYPGFGHSDMPDRAQFRYSFAHFADITDMLLTHLRVTHYALYVMDYGAPVGYRLAVKHPERVTALVIQNGNAYEEGLKEFWKPIKAYWASGQPATEESCVRAPRWRRRARSTSTASRIASARRSERMGQDRRCSIVPVTSKFSSISSTTTARIPSCIRSSSNSSVSGSRRR